MNPYTREDIEQLEAVLQLGETLAAGLVQLSNWNKDRIFVDPFCGSGTLAIEAAMLGANIAPGLNREFISEGWKNIIPPKLWMEAVDEAYDKQINNELDIQGYDIDFKVLKTARENAKLANVDEMIHFQERDINHSVRTKNMG